MDHQGGKLHGKKIEGQKAEIDEINKELIVEDQFKEIEDVEAKLEEFKNTFVVFDNDMDGVIGVMDMKKAMEDMGQAKTHLEVMKMIREVDKENKDAINYREFVDMMLGTRTTVLKLIIMFEKKAKNEQNIPKDPPPKKSISDLP